MDGRGISEVLEIEVQRGGTLVELLSFSNVGVWFARLIEHVGMLWLEAFVLGLV